MKYAVKSSDGRMWGDYSTKREASQKATTLRRDAKRSGFRGSFRVVTVRENSTLAGPILSAVRSNGRKVKSNTSVKMSLHDLRRLVSAAKTGKRVRVKARVR